MAREWKKVYIVDVGTFEWDEIVDWNYKQFTDFDKAKEYALEQMLVHENAVRMYDDEDWVETEEAT